MPIIKQFHIGVVLVFTFALMASNVFAQKFDTGNGQGNKVESNSKGGSSNYRSPNCPVTHVSTRCLPRQKLPRATSKDNCDCQIRMVKNGGTTLWVRDCYVQLPDETVYFCKNPIHQAPRT